MPHLQRSVFIGRTTEVSRDVFQQVQPSIERDAMDEDAMDTSEDHWMSDIEMDTSEPVVAAPPVKEPPGAPGRLPPGRSKLQRGVETAKLETSPSSHRGLRPRRKPQAPAASATAAAAAAAVAPRRKKGSQSQSGKSAAGVGGKEYEVEKILDTCVEEGTLVQYYLVKWKGYDSRQNTWEPKRNLGKCRALIEEFAAGR